MIDNTQKHILIVEDDYDYHTRLNDFLSSHDFNVSVADSGDMAMDKLLFHKANLVLLDLLLPKVDGFEIIKRIREYPDSEIAQTPIVVVSNLNSEADVARANEYGISGYLVKSSTSYEEIFEKINEVLYGGEKNPTYEVSDTEFKNLINDQNQQQ